MRFWKVHKEDVFRRSRYICACRLILWKLINPISREGPKRKSYIHWKISFSPKVPIPLCGPQYHLTVSRTQVSTHRGRVFLKLFADKLLVFKWSQVQVYFFWNSYESMLCLCHYGPALLRFWFQIDLGRENSASFFKVQAGETFSYHGHALVTLYIQFLCPDWSKSDRWVHAESLCSILKLVYFDSWGWQSFVSTCVVFNCLFPLDVQNAIQLPSRVFCYWFVYWVFGLEMRRL